MNESLWMNVCEHSLLERSHSDKVKVSMNELEQHVRRVLDRQNVARET